MSGELAFAVSEAAAHVRKLREEGADHKQTSKGQSLRSGEWWTTEEGQQLFIGDITLDSLRFQLDELADAFGCDVVERTTEGYNPSNEDYIASQYDPVLKETIAVFRDAAEEHIERHNADSSGYNKVNVQDDWFEAVHDAAPGFPDGSDIDEEEWADFWTDLASEILNGCSATTTFAHADLSTWLTKNPLPS